MLTEDYELLRYPIMKPEGDTMIKRNFINFLPGYFQMVDSTRFDHTIYLPGVDSINCFKFDGSVRVYSSESFYINKKQINMSFYGTYNGNYSEHISRFGQKFKFLCLHKILNFGPNGRANSISS